MNNLYPTEEFTPSDETLMQAVMQDRSERALDELYQRYGSVLRNVIMRVMRDESEVDDVLQDVFVQVWSRADAYSPEKGRLLGWLIILARRRALDRLRQRCAYNRARDRFETEYHLPVDEFQGNRAVDRQVCDDDLRHLLNRMLHRLPPNQEQVVQMTFFEGMSQRQIAAALAIPLGTVKTRIELGMRKLTNVLNPVREKVA